jgi:hypothetical protein
VTTRVVRLEVQGVGGADEVRQPLGVRIFHRDTIYWIRTRVVPQLTLKVVLFHVIDEIERREVAALPVNLFHYSTFDLAREIPLLPDLAVEDVGSTILFVHESEFVTAFDRNRRVELIADVVNRLEERYQASFEKRRSRTVPANDGPEQPESESPRIAVRPVHGYGSTGTVGSAISVRIGS